MRDINTLSGFIKMVMEAKGLSNRELGKRALISEGAVRNLLKVGTSKERSKPDTGTLYRIANALNVNPVILFELSGFIPPKTETHSPTARYLADLYDNTDQEFQARIIQSTLDIIASVDNPKVPVVSI